jgi:3-oxoacyl-[acyl-carrier-protein] synthase-3
VNKETSIGILGLGSFLPEKILTNNDLERMVDTSDEWITKRTGMKERHLLEDDVPAYTMGLKAAERALQDANLKAEDIELIIVSTDSPDYLFPTTACQIQNGLGAFNAGAFDMNSACTGFIYALSVGEQFIKTGKYKNILIVSNEGLSRIVDWEDRNTCVLFGDGAGAAVIGEVEDGYGIQSFHLGAKGDLGHNLTQPCCFISDEDREKRPSGKEQVIWMDGTEVFKFAVGAMTDATNKVIADVGLTIDDIDMIFPHQANARIIKSSTKRLKISSEKVFKNLEKMGNISSACIPVGLDEAKREGRLKKGDNIVLVAFGGGLTYGAMCLKWI